MSDPPASPEDFTQELLRWSEALAGIARTGLGFTQSLYEQERFEEVLKVASDMRAAAEEDLEVRREAGHFLQEWLDSVGEGVPGYVTPKVAVGAVVGNDEGQILLVQRSDSGIWLYPTGWADVGYSPAEVAVKEVLEETGIECEVLRLHRRDRRLAHGVHPGAALLAGVPLQGHRRDAATRIRSRPRTSGGSARTTCRSRSSASTDGGPRRSQRSAASRSRCSSTSPAAPVWRGDD